MKTFGILPIFLVMKSSVIQISLEQPMYALLTTYPPHLVEDISAIRDEARLKL